MLAGMPADAPLTRDSILAAAVGVLRRFGPAKATVVDVARALGVTHAAVYRHFASKAELRAAVVAMILGEMAAPARAAAAGRGTPARRLRRAVDAYVAEKRRRAGGDPELFAAYLALAAESGEVVGAHVAAMTAVLAGVVADGVADGSFAATADPAATARAIVSATTRFHHPAHAAAWSDPDIDADYDRLWQLILDGLRGR